MKTKVFYSSILIALLSISVAFGQEKTEKFKVYGNCNLCEKRIEKAAKSLEGVSAAEWSQETKMIEVSFDSGKTDLHKIHKAIADAGHDTEMHKAKKETYESLPACCQYERAKATENEHKEHSH